MASRENQEIGGGVLKDLVEKARHTVNTDTTSAFRGICDDKQGQGIFNEKGIGCWVWVVDNGKSIPYASESAT